MSSESPARVVVENLCKTFYFYRHPLHRLTSWVTRGRHGAPTPFHALRDVAFTLHAGTSMGIIGVNGSGKSTLLKIITGTMEPTSGTTRVEGRLASLLELGTGFHPLFTGRQNIRYNARFIGLTDDEIDERMPAIEAFSEIGDFLDRPLRTYSTGMHVRLAFSVAASVSPDVLVVDEVLAVGDMYFQQKCISRIREFRDRGVTILFVSHDPGAVKSLCDRAVLLHDARILEDGEPGRVLEHYNALIARKKAESDYFAVERASRHAGRGRSGSFEALVADVDLLDATDRPVRAVLTGERLTIRVRVFFLEPLENPTIGILIRDRLGNDVYGTNTYLQRMETGRWEAGAMLEARFAFETTLGAGEYSISAAVHSFAGHLVNSYDWVDKILLFRVLPVDERISVGVADLRAVIAVTPAADVPRPADVIASVLGTVPSTLVLGDEAGALLRSGWHAVEHLEGGPHRWMGRDAAFMLTLVEPCLHIEAGADRRDGTSHVTVRVSTLGRELGAIQVPNGPGWHDLHLDLPPEMPRGPAYLRLTTDAADRGIRIRRIWSGEGDASG